MKQDEFLAPLPSLNGKTLIFDSDIRDFRYWLANAGLIIKQMLGQVEGNGDTPYEGYQSLKISLSKVQEIINKYENVAEIED